MDQVVNPLIGEREKHLRELCGAKIDVFGAEDGIRLSLKTRATPPRLIHPVLRLSPLVIGR